MATLENDLANSLISYKIKQWFLLSISQSNHTRTTALSNSMKLSHARGHGATQDRRVMVERFDRMWSTGEGNGKPLQYSCLENLGQMPARNSFLRSKTADKTIRDSTTSPGQTRRLLISMIRTHGRGPLGQKLSPTKENEKRITFKEASTPTVS